MIFPVLEKERVHRDNLVWLLFAQAASILPLLFYLPIWLIFFWLSAIFWRIQIHRMKWVYPNLLGKMLLGGSCVLAVWLSFQGIKSVEPMIAFLVCSFILKTVELHTKKDALIILFIGFIAIACQFLFAQDLASGLYGFFSLCVLLSAWQAAFFSRAVSIATCLKRGGLMVVQSIPFMIVLFVIMPRIGPLWSVPMPKGQAQTGFSESLKLGDVGDLARSPQTAFRVRFSGAPPPLDQLYWRGLILDDFDGVEWRMQHYFPENISTTLSTLEQTKSQYSGKMYRYSIVLEPHSYPWLFSLKTPLAAESSQLKLMVNRDGILTSRNPVINKSEYEVVSNSDVVVNPLSTDGWQNLITLPEQGNKRAQALADQWRRQYQMPEDIIQAAFRFYQTGFFYTLQPTMIADNAIDQFLFETKNGFCEHFASSFVYLMRAAGIPARIVVGYQGAHFNQVDNYFLVKQSDAHAWAEVWLNERWQMFDPTTAVAPSRISLGMEQALDDADLIYLDRSIWQSDVLQGVYQRWDALGFAWNRWVLNYDTQNQEGLLKKLLGNTGPWRVGLAFVGVCAFIFISYIVLQYYTKFKKAVSEENRLIMPVLNALSRRGYQRLPRESVSEFSQRLTHENPILGKSFAVVAKAYTLSVYRPNAKSLHHLKLAINQFQQ